MRGGRRLPVVGALAALVLGGCSSPGVTSGPDSSASAATDLPAGVVAASPSGPAPLPASAAATMSERELRLARALAAGGQDGFWPATCGVVEVATRGEDVYGWTSCSTVVDGVEGGSAGVVGLRSGRLWQPRDGSELWTDLEAVLGAERAGWVQEHEDALTAQAGARLR